MTAQILHLPPRMFPAPIDRDEQVDNARAVLRHAADFDDQIISDACLILQAWGDPADWLEADAMMLALRLNRRPRPVDPVKPTGADYAAALPGLAALAALFVACVWGLR
jgi:hypothetical protein